MISVDFSKNNMSKFSGDLKIKCHVTIAYSVKSRIVQSNSGLKSFFFSFFDILKVLFFFLNQITDVT